MTVAEFLERAPEFRTFKSNAPNGEARIQAALDAATRRSDAAVFGDETDTAIYLLAAHLLCASPTGKDARLKGEGFVSVYLQTRNELVGEKCPLLGTIADLGC